MGGGDEEAPVVQSAAFRNCMCLWLQEKLVARPVSSRSAAEAMAGCSAWGWPLWTAEAFMAKPLCSWVAVGPLPGGICLCVWNEYPKVIGFWFFIIF